MPPTRRFLFLQGPHGPFFHRLGRRLRAAGCDVWRVGFNGGDRAFWPDGVGYLPYPDPLAAWPDACAALLDGHGITDLVLYGDTRPVHAQAIAAARARTIRVHVFEEGYLRPFWVTYERGGANGHSPLMDRTIPQMRAALAGVDTAQAATPAHWGDMRHHIFYGALYHLCVLAGRGGYRAYRPHRGVTVGREAGLHLRRLLCLPLAALDRHLATTRIVRGGFPYHLGLLQLEHDASFRAHSPYASMTEVLRVVIAGFAAGAPPHHHLILKAHPLEDGRAPLRATIRDLARDHQVHGRVHYVAGGKLARLMDEARSAITVNSTAAQQALWRGLPVKALGRSVFAKPELVSDQSMADFFADPRPPERGAYRTYRQYLLRTSQVPGGFYSARGRQRLLRRIVDRMLSDVNPYDRIAAPRAEPRKNLKLASG
ncbi:MAG: capsule biosynthesis protein CapA [Pseudomonadota bacterium]